MTQFDIYNPKTFLKIHKIGLNHVVFVTLKI